MRGTRAKVIRHTAHMLFGNKEYMKLYPEWFTERMLYQLMKTKWKR